MARGIKQESTTNPSSYCKYCGPKDENEKSTRTDRRTREDLNEPFTNKVQTVHSSPEVAEKLAETCAPNSRRRIQFSGL